MARHRRCEMSMFGWRGGAIPEIDGWDRTFLDRPQTAIGPCCLFFFSPHLK